MSNPAEFQAPDVAFEDATPDALPEVAELARRIWPEAYAQILSAVQCAYMLDLFYAPDRLRRDIAQGVRFVFVQIAGRRVGYFAYGPSSRTGEATLHKLYLLQEHHGRGVGSASLAEAVRRARTDGYLRLSLAVNRHNAKALRAYLRNGFQKQGEQVIEIGGGFVMDDFVLVRTL